MAKKKKKGFSIFKVIGVAAVAFGVGAAYVNRHNSRVIKKMNKHKNANNLMSTICLNNGTVDIGASTNYAYLSSIFGNMDIKIAVPEKKEMQVDIFNLFANMDIKVPEGVNVKYEAEDINANLEYEPKDEEIADAPTIRIVGRNKFGNVTISTLVKETCKEK